MTNFVRLFHGGDLGDTIYAIPALRRLADPAHLTLYPNYGVTRAIMDADNAAMIIPLLNIQRGITADWQPAHAEDGLRLDFAVRRFYQGSMNLSDMHSHWVGHDHWRREHPWIVADRADGRYKIVVARSARYRNQHFPWKKLYSQFGDRACFIGVPWEHENFEHEVGRIHYERTPTLLDAARLMAGADIFIGNQSCPRALAEALKIPVVVEQNHPMNTHFGRECAWYPNNSISELPAMDDSGLEAIWCQAAAKRADERMKDSEPLARACRLARFVPGEAAVVAPDPTGPAAVVAWSMTRPVNVCGQNPDRRFLGVYHIKYCDDLPKGPFALAYISRSGSEVIRHFRERMSPGGVIVVADGMDPNINESKLDGSLSVWRNS